MTKVPLSIFDKLYKIYSGNTGKMLIHTGVIGWILSSAAQISAIIFNDKIPKEQKMFLIPQEFMDACINIVSFYLVTQSFSSIAKKLSSTGKWLPANVKKYILNHPKLTEGLGTLGSIGFDMSKVKLPYKQNRSFKLFANGLDVVGTTLGSIISCNIITPIGRNLYASWRQKDNIAKMNTPEGKCNPLYGNRSDCPVRKAIARPITPNSGNLKV